MSAAPRSRFHGPLRAVVFDWSGTIIDHGCFAPAEVFVAVFARYGITISWEQARAPMGLAKLDHVRAILAMPEVAAAWRAVHRRDWSDVDAQTVFQATIALQVEATVRHATLIPGALDAVAACRARGLLIGTTTGYSRAIMDALAPVASRQGYAPDATVCADEVPAGRPAPWMLLRAAELLNVFPPAAIVKVGDTVPDIAEAINAGAWSVGLSLSGNEPGLTAAEAAALTPDERVRAQVPIVNRLRAAGAHYVIASVADLPTVLDDLAEHVSKGENPYEFLPQTS